LDVLKNNNSDYEIPIKISIDDIKGFETDGFPQVWRGAYLNNPPAEPINGVIYYTTGTLRILS
jgi:hypothetical protein